MTIFNLDSHYRLLYATRTLLDSVSICHVCMAHAIVKSHSSFESSQGTIRFCEEEYDRYRIFFLLTKDNLLHFERGEKE